MYKGPPRTGNRESAIGAGKQEQRREVEIISWLPQNLSILKFFVDEFT